MRSSWGGFPFDRMMEGLQRHEGNRTEESISLSRFEIIREVGSGAFALVYQARDTVLQRTVALKVLRNDIVQDDAVINRFRREASTLAGLNDPGLVVLYDIGENAGKPFLVMEYVEGQNLEQALLESEIQVRPILEILVRVCRAIGAAHRAKIIHRDLKPANVLLSHDLQPKVADFGLAHLLDPKVSLSQSQATVGTPLYMAPEQIWESVRTLTPAADVYSLGVILYEVLTGRAPHVSDSLHELTRLVRDEEPVPVRRREPRIHRDLETICMKSLEKNPTRRYSSGQEMGEDLERYLKGEPILARPVGTMRRIGRRLRKHKIGLAIACTLFGAAVAFLAYSAVQSVQRSAEAQKRVREAEQAYQDRNWARAANLYGEALKLGADGLKFDSKRRAARAMEQAEKAAKKRETLIDRAERTVIPIVEDHEAASNRRGKWKNQDQKLTWNRKSWFQETEAVHLARTALALDPSLSAAREILYKIYRERYDKSRIRRDRVAVAIWRGRIERDCGDDYVRLLTTYTRVIVQIENPGATAYLFRYQQSERREIPFPCNGRGEIRNTDVVKADALPLDASDEEAAAIRTTTAYPLPVGDFNKVRFPLILPGGSYLVLFRKTGCADTRLPLLVKGDAPIERGVRLLPTGAIPRGFLYICSGIGNGRSRERVRAVESFHLARYPTTAGEYLKFLNDRSYHSEKSAAKRLPRSLVRASSWKGAEGVFRQPPWWRLDAVVLGISYADAMEYAKWYTKKFGKGKWIFRLPRIEEWEKAARGADGRFYTWGFRFDYSFSALKRSRRASERAQDSRVPRIGFFPADESPFGVRDMCGTSTEWVQDSGKPPVPWGKGGAFNSKKDLARIGSFSRKHWGRPNVSIGFRLAAVPVGKK